MITVAFPARRPVPGFTLGGLALIVLLGPVGGTSTVFQSLVVGGFSEPLPSILWIAGALLLVWVPFKRSRWGIALYAVESDRRTAFLSGVNVARTRVAAYALSGLFSGAAGIVTVAFTGSGEPRASIGAIATLTSVAAVVLGGWHWSAASAACSDRCWRRSASP